MVEYRARVAAGNLLVLFEHKQRREDWLLYFMNHPDEVAISSYTIPRMIVTLPICASALTGQVLCVFSADASGQN